MSESPPPPEYLDLSQVDDPRDVVHRAVACLAQGGLVGLATETSYGLAASALRSEGVDRLTRWGDRSGALALLLRGADEAADWVPELSDEARRLARRVWPGPVVLRASGGADAGLVARLPEAVRTRVVGPEGLDLRVTPHPFVREVLRLSQGPLVFGRDGVNSAEELVAEGSGLDMIIDSGPVRVAEPPTLVRVGPDGWEVVRPGAVDAVSLRRLAGTILLFVCTGNTCRSPMAEAICKLLLAQRLGCAVDDLEGRGMVVLSAGVAAMNGMPAAANAVEVVRSWGGSLQKHVSRSITPELIRHADLIVAMTNDHLEALLDRVPECAPRARLLHPHGGDVADPVGLDRETYLRTAEEIKDYLGHLLDELGC